MHAIKILISATKLTSALLLAVSGTATPALAGKVGLLGLYQVKDADRYAEALKAFERSLSDRGCAVRREGKIAAMDGSLNIAKPTGSHCWNAPARCSKEAPRGRSSNPCRPAPTT